MAVWPPIDWPTSVTGRPGDTTRITAATSAVNAARDTSAGRRVLWPCPRRSGSANRRERPTAAAVAMNSSPAPASPCSATTTGPSPSFSRKLSLTSLLAISRRRNPESMTEG
jgi:hypothetical protein